MGHERRYSPDEVTAIVANALRRHRERVNISHDELLETAAELGISPVDIEEAARHLSSERDMEWARKKWRDTQVQGWKHHLVSFLIMNGFMMMLDLSLSGGSWFYFPLIGWGIGLAFHSFAVFFPDPDQVEQGARHILEAKQTPP